MKEATAITLLRKLERGWPPDLWLFAANGILYVMRRGGDGKPVMMQDGSFDQAYVLDSFNIPCDGGDW